MDAICLIAAPRTGTNHLCEVLKNFEDLASFLELFENDGAHGTDPETWPLLRRLTGVDFANHRDRRLIAYTRENPSGWLDAVEAAAKAQGKRVMSFKLFRHNLPVETIEREIMPRTGVRVMMVVRRQIDSYVSWRKAVELGKWQDVDTTGIRLTLDPDSFAEWLDAQERWYDHWRNYLNRRFLPCPVLRYESDIDQQPAEAVLRRFAGAAAQLGITLKVPGAIATRGLQRQDRARNIGDKVRNWSEFSREVFKRGLEKRAFGYPS
ncbi:MAG: hypothetical protein Q8L54_14645 [Devosia sp.]|nr:hypothetical protein [Devosia sp.]